MKEEEKKPKEFKDQLTEVLESGVSQEAEKVEPKPKKLKIKKAKA